MSKPLISVLAAGLVVLTATPSTSAQELYCSAYQAAPNLDALLFTGQTEAEFLNRFNALDSQHVLLDVEAYYDAAGQLLYDIHTGWNTNGWSTNGLQKLIMGVDEAALIGWNDAYTSDHRMTDLTSWLVSDGTRRYTAVWTRGTAGDVFFTGLTQSQFEAEKASQAGSKRAPMIYETWYDTDGVRRIDVSFQDVSANHYSSAQMNTITFQDTIASQAALGNVMLMFECHRSEAGTPRYAATWDTDGPFSSAEVVVSFDDELAYFLAEYAQQKVNGHRLIDMVHLEETVTAERHKYGSGLAGTEGVPGIGLTDNPWLGRTLDVTLGNKSGGATLGALFIGLAPAALPFKGGELLVLPALDPLLFPLPADGLSLPVTLPGDALLEGVHLYIQLAHSDAGAPNGVALSRGLDMTLGTLD